MTNEKTLTVSTSKVKRFFKDVTKYGSSQVGINTAMQIVNKTEVINLRVNGLVEYTVNTQRKNVYIQSGRNKGYHCKVTRFFNVTLTDKGRNWLINNS